MIYIQKRQVLLTAIVLVFFQWGLCSQGSSSRGTSSLENDSSGSGFSPTLQKEFVIVDSVQNFDLNPHTATYASEAQLLTGLSEGLFSYDPQTLEPLPAIAETYHVSEDKLVWTFTIREGTKFSNGDAITAETVRDSWMTLLSPDKKAPYASLLDCISGAEAYRTGNAAAEKVMIRARDTRTLEVTLNSPAEHFSKILCHHAFSAVSPKQDVWSGPFTIASRTADEIILTKNEQYWDAANTALPSIKFLITQDLQHATYMYNIGTAHWLCDTIDYQRILAPDTIHVAPLFATEYLFFRIDDTSPWNNPDLRNALVKAVPWETLREAYIIPAETMIFPLNGYPRVKGLAEQDMDEALRLLEKAGYGIPTGENSGKARPKLVINIPSYDSYSKQLELLTAAWSDLGIIVEAVSTDSALYQDAIKTADADIFLYIWIGDFADPLAFLELFRGSSSLNETGWKNDDYEKLLAEAAKLTDPSKRYKKLAEAEQLLLDSGIVLPLSHTVSVNVIELLEIGGWYENALDIHPLKHLFFTHGRQMSNITQIE
ncbi:MAG: peptide ABC transporter substrate-binding protein [Spirochaetaceae bacterium]|jgi:oligopeptide transport system substrate-binding protein|nr:peptide ABC transporter substrate-binding protein [Spirochaetaceae bacterium]